MNGDGLQDDSMRSSSAQAAFWASVLDQFLPGAASLLDPRRTVPASGYDAVERGAAWAARALLCPFSFVAVEEATGYAVEVVQSVPAHGSTPEDFTGPAFRRLQLKPKDVLKLVTQEKKAHTLEIGDEDALHDFGVDSAALVPLYLPRQKKPRVLAVCNRPDEYADATREGHKLRRIPYGAGVAFGNHDKGVLQLAALIVERVY